jgi:hypothetical protein
MNLNKATTKALAFIADVREQNPDVVTLPQPFKSRHPQIEGQPPLYETSLTP